MSDNINNFISNAVSSNDVVLFMKGSEDFPQCGFSAAVVSILQKLNVEFFDVNVLESSELRQGIKDFSDWPTIPQLYIKGEFIGGCDIVKELYSAGELQEILKSNKLI
jgi:monothiol glutaredoxin